MKKIVILSVFITLLMAVYGGNKVFADWWERPTARPTQPSVERDGVPTAVPTTQVVPTTAPSTQPQQPTATPRIGEPTVAPTSIPSSGGSGSGEDPCASGNSYTGSYCGWSPEKDQPGSTSGSGGSEAPRIGGPEVLGLSYTSSGDLTVSDIMLLTGVLCLALYVRSKLSLVIRRP